MSAYCVAFSAIVHAISRGNSLWQAIDKAGLRFVVEHGHPNNADIAVHFDRLQRNDLYGDCLKSLEFSGKDGSRAIQLAYFFAFYSRRWADRSIAHGNNPKTQPDDELRALDQYLPHFMHVVNDAYAGEVTDPNEMTYRANRPPGPIPSEKPVTPRPRRRGDKRA